MATAVGRTEGQRLWGLLFAGGLLAAAVTALRLTAYSYGLQLRAALALTVVAIGEWWQMNRTDYFVGTLQGSDLALLGS